MTGVHARAHTHADRAGDPLDGLVNLFDVGVVLAVAFLLVALTALRSPRAPVGPAQPPGVRTVPTGAPLVSPGGGQVQGQGTKVGTVYRLQDGRLAYVPGG